MKDQMFAAWPRLPISDFAKTAAGGTPAKSNRAFYDGGDIPWLMSGEVASRDIVEASKFITPEGLAGSSAKMFPPGSVLVAMYGATAGEVGILRFEAATNQAVCAILPGDNHVPEYLYYYLLSANADLVSQAIGNAQPNISQAKVKATQVPLPPLEEQKRIVAVLDQALAALDRARAHAEANLADAKHLMQVASDSILDRATCFVDETALGSFLVKATYGFTNPMPDSDTGPWKVTAKNVVGGRIDYGSARHTTNEAFQTKLTDKSRPMVGDVLLTKDGTLGRTAVVDREDICVNQSVAVLRADERVIPEFMSALLSSSDIQASLIERAGGTTVKHIYITRVPETQVRIPSLTEQRKALVEMNNASSRIRSTIESFSAKITDIADLRQSLLQKAFSGQLT